LRTIFTLFFDKLTGVGRKAGRFFRIGFRQKINKEMPMKTIRRTRIKITQKELVVVKNETLQVCPVCNFPVQQKVPFGDGDSVERPHAGDKKLLETPAKTNGRKKS
jgi:hypothetical protein